jgi:hypothetical protein
VERWGTGQLCPGTAAGRAAVMGVPQVDTRKGGHRAGAASPPLSSTMAGNGSLTFESDWSAVGVHLLTSVASAYAGGYGETRRRAWFMPLNG